KTRHDTCNEQLPDGRLRYDAVQDQWNGRRDDDPKRSSPCYEAACASLAVTFGQQQRYRDESYRGRRRDAGTGDRGEDGACPDRGNAEGVWKVTEPRLDGVEQVDACIGTLHQRAGQNEEWQRNKLEYRGGLPRDLGEASKGLTRILHYQRRDQRG